jgi:predicted site-specific integrase-resolvase
MICFLYQIFLLYFLCTQNQVRRNKKPGMVHHTTGGMLKANRTPTDRRYYTYDQYLQFKGIQTENDIRDVVIYARVSTRNQKDDLHNQVEFLKQFCNAKGR